MKFISSACNLRCSVFGLNMQTEYEVKEVAGNIVPAIASTNSMVSGIEITESIKLLQRAFYGINYESCNKYSSRELYVQNDTKTKILDVKPGALNPLCMSCNPNVLPHIVECDFNETKLAHFIKCEVRRKDMLEESENEENEDELKNFSISNG